jgi:alkylated DNA repair protein alkB family protein 8
MHKNYANYLLKKTKDDYNRIADKFSSTRGYISNDILELNSFVNIRDNILDLGCGNGRLSEVFKEMNVTYIGTDNSREMIKIAKKKYPKEKFIVSDALCLPFKDNIFDKVFSLSVIQHIPSVELRIKFLKEVQRVLKPKGKLIITAWYINQNKIKKYLTENPKFDKGDIFYPFKIPERKIEVLRYIHCFKRDELIKLIEKSGFKVEKSSISQRGSNKENKNILVIAKKI